MLWSRDHRYKESTLVYNHRNRYYMPSWGHIMKKKKILQSSLQYRQKLTFMHTTAWRSSTSTCMNNVFMTTDAYRMAEFTMRSAIFPFDSCTQLTTSECRGEFIDLSRKSVEHCACRTEDEHKSAMEWSRSKIGMIGT